MRIGNGAGSAGLSEVLRTRPLGVGGMGVAREQGRPGALLFGVAPQPTEGESPTDERLFAQLGAAGVGEVAVELRESTSRVAQPVEEQTSDDRAR